MTVPIFQHSYYVDWNGDGLFSHAKSDVTQYVITADWQMGRQQSLNVSGPIGMGNIASGTWVVRNETGLFTNTSTSALTGKLKPRRYVKIVETVTFGGVTLSAKTIFYGVIRNIQSVSSSKTTDRRALIEVADLLYVLQSTKTGMPVQYNQTLDAILQAYVSTALGEPANSLVFVFNSDPASGSAVTFNIIPNVVGLAPGTGALAFIFDNAGTVTTANHIQQGLGASATAANFAAAINQGDGLNTLYGPVNPPLTDFQAVVTGGTTVTLTSVLSGNSTCCAFGAFLTGTGTAISLAGSTTNGVTRNASGGVDWPISWDSPRKSKTSLAVAAQRWTKKDTFAYTAIKEMVDTELGRFYQDNTGTLVFHSRDYNFNRLAATVALTDSNGVGNYTMRTSDDDTYGVIRVTSTPNISVQKGVVLGKLSGASVPGNSTKTIHIPYTDWQSGAACGGVPTLPLVAGQDWSANEKADGTGTDYTPGFSTVPGGPYLALTYTPLASGLDVIAKNTATGTLYFVPPTLPKTGQGTPTLQVRGQAITNFSTVLSEKITDNTRRVMAFTLPMTDDTNYADSVANWLSNRYGSDSAKIVNVMYGEKGLYPIVGSNAILSAGIDSVLSYARAADGISATLLEIVGMKFHLEPHKAEVTLYSWPVDNQHWFLLDNATYSKLDSSNKLVI